MIHVRKQTQMPSLANHQSNEFTKMIIIGDSKAGKTGLLTSLVKEGYKLRILDYDNGLDVLKSFVLKDCPDKIGNVEYRTIRDQVEMGAVGPKIKGKALAYSEGLKMMGRWKFKEHDGTEVDLGTPAEWGKDTIFVLDSLSRFSDSAFDWADGISTNPDKRSVFYDAQGAVISAIDLLTGDNFRCNVIVIAHIRYITQADGSMKGFPQAVGTAVCTEIPQFFNTYVLVQQKGGKRTLQTTSTPLIDLANPKPFEMLPSYPIETGLADCFKVLRGQPKTTPTLVRKA